MSFGDVYQVQPGDRPLPGPPVDLPSFQGPPRVIPRVDVDVPIAPRPVKTQSITDPYAALPDWKAPEAKQTEAPPIAPSQPGTPGGDPYAALEEWKPAATPAEQAPHAPVSTSDAAVAGALKTFSFGAAPVVAGLAQAAGPEWQQTDVYGPEGNPAAPIVGAVKMVGNALSSHPDPQIRAAYERGRQAALEDERAAQDQHPVAFLAGQLAGAFTTPTFGVARAGNLGARLLQGGVAGATGGGLYGAGEAASEGGSASDIGKGALTGAALGAPTGAVLSGIIGPRVVNPNSPGQRAAATAESLGAPLPKGLASDSKFIQGTTAKLRSVPFAGEKIGERVGETAEAAGNRVENIASGMAGGAPERAAADAVVRPGLQNVINANRQSIDAAYNGVRTMIDQNQHYTMPNTQNALNAIMAARHAAGHVKPDQGLEQFNNVSRAATFDGAHRARFDAREAGNVMVPHPGYNAGDFNKLTRAMSVDLRNMVRAAAKQNPQAALDAFNQAEKQFATLSKQNDLLHKIVNSQGEGAIATLLGAAREKGGNLKLLAQLRQSMSPQDFETIGGTLLHELGHNNATGEFSLSQFSTNVDKLSEQGLGVLFSPNHLQEIKDIAGLGRHLKGSLAYSNTSHTASVLVLLDVAKDAALLGADVASGGLGAGSAIGAGTTAGLWLLTKWLASPARAASMSAWQRAYMGLTASPTPARTALFNVATRNLANNLGVPVDVVLQSVRARLPSSADVSGSPENPRQQ